MECYQPGVYFTSAIDDKNKEEFVEVITLSMTGGVTFPVTNAGVHCNPLIDTSAKRSCTSETFYNKLMLPWLLKSFYITVTFVQWLLYNVCLN